MKRFLCILLVSMLIMPGAFAEYKPSLPEDKPRQLEVEPGLFGKIVLHENDLEEDTLCATIRAIIENGGLSEGQTVSAVRLVKAVLTIEVQWEEGSTGRLTNGMMAQTRAMDITEALLDYVELDQFWETIQLVFPLRKAILTKNMIETNEYGGRYFDALEILKQIPD